MKKICILQMDNRPDLKYLLKTQEVNKKFSEYLGYDYKFIYLNNIYNVDYKTAKLYILNNFIQNTIYDVFIFLDSDAWIQNYNWLNDMIIDLIKNEKNGCFSRDPYIISNTFINSGSFIIKINEFTKKMFNDFIIELENDIEKKVFNKYGWEDQYYISKFVFENKEKFNVFIPEILNTPHGQILRHNWFKNQKMYDDLNELLLQNLDNNKTLFIIKHYLDEQIFPNNITNGYIYDD